MSQKISRQNLQSIHRVACSKWKTKIEKMALREDPFSDLITLEDSEVWEMYDASLPSQRSLLDTFFKMPVFHIDYMKIGDCLLVDDVFGEVGLLLKTFDGIVNLYKPNETWQSCNFSGKKVEVDFKIKN